MTSIRPSAPQTNRSRSALRAATFALCTAGLIASFAGVGGCQTAKKPTEDMPMAASPERVAQVRAEIQHNNPGATIGRVIYTLTEDGKKTADKSRPYTAVGDLPVQDVKRGQIVTFVDVASGNPINSGVVQDLYSDSFAVRYDPSGKRAPMSGDLAVLFKD